MEGARVLGGSTRTPPGSSFDKVAALPQPVRAGSARGDGDAAPRRRSVAFATSSALSTASTGTATAAQQRRAEAAGSALQTTNWSRDDARQAKQAAEREASPDLKEIDRANAAEFDDKLAQVIAAEGLDMDRDWYLREEEGGFGDDGGGGLGDESTLSLIHI